MDIIKTLKEIRYIHMELEYTRKRLETLRSNKASIKSSSDVGTQAGSHVSNPNKNPMDLVCNITDLERTLEGKLSKLYKLEKQVEEELETLEPIERLIVKLHYFDGETLECICGVIGYSYRHTKRIFREAIGKLREVS